MKRSRRTLPETEYRAILRAADDIIAQGGRTLLVKILKGSKERKVLELGLDQNPSYGFYRDLTLEQIMDKVDTMIDTGFLGTERQGKLPMIIFTPYGWAVEREQRAQEFLQEWDHWLEHNVTPVSMEYLKERNRGMMLLFLYKILCSANKKYIPYLRLWEQVEFKKVQREIRHVIEALEQREGMNDKQWGQLVGEMAHSLLLRSDNPIILACGKCGNPFLLDESNPDYYTNEGLQFPQRCPQCL